MEKAVLYLRLSKEDQDKLSEGDDSASIKSQRLLLTDYALEHDYQIVDVYSDDNESGLYDDRPDFERMIEDAKLGKFSVIIAKTQSRFSRNMEHIEKYLHHDFPILGIRFIGVADGTDTADMNNKKTRQISGLVNEWYCEDLSKNIRSAFKAKMKNGEYLGPHCPYGYMKDPENHNHLIIDEYAANIVKEIFKLYLQGNSKTRIAKILDERSVLIPSLYKKQVQGLNFHIPNSTEHTQKWTFTTVHLILNNQMYLGNMVQHRFESTSYKDRTKKNVKPSEWIIVLNTHEAIISEETFLRAKEIQKIRTKEVNKTARESGIFSGLLVCHDCGHRLVRKYRKGGDRRFLGYMCGRYKQYGTTHCTMHNVDYDKLCDVVLRSIQNEAKKILSNNDINSLKKSAIVSEREELIDRELQILYSRSDKINQYKQKTYEAYLDEMISREDYKRYTTKYDKELQEINLSIQKTNIEKDNIKELDQEYLLWVNKFSDYVNITELTRPIVVELIEKIEIYENSAIKIYYRFTNPYDTKQ